MAVPESSCATGTTPSLKVCVQRCQSVRLCG